MRCLTPRGTLYNAEKGMYIACPCGRWNCSGCAEYKGKKIAARLASLRPDFFVTLDLDHHAWATPANAREMQARMRSLFRWMDRQRWLEGYAWVNEAGAKAMLCTACELPRRSHRDSRDGCRCEAPALVAACVCDRDLRGCICGAGGENLHRHLAFRVGQGGRNRDGRPFFPWERLHVAARRLGLVVSDIRPVFSHGGVGQYMAKFARYLAKSFDSPLHAPVGEPRVVGYRLKRWKTRKGFGGEVVHSEWKPIIEWRNRTRRYGFSQEAPPVKAPSEWTYFSSPIEKVVLFREGVLIADEVTGAIPQFFSTA